jgi:hypothetical protein
MGNPTKTGAPRFPASAGSLAAHFERLHHEDLGTIAEAAIAELDRRAGDPDIEANGDELDGCMSEEGFHDQGGGWVGAAGCPVSDPGGSAEEYAMLPTYGDDQSLGPINERDAARARNVGQLGLVRADAGGWGMPA